MDCLVKVAFGLANSCAASDFATTEYEWIFWLSVTTAAAFVALAVFRVLYLVRCPLVVRPPTILLFAKALTGAAFAGLRIGILVLAFQQVTPRTSQLVASKVLDVVAACLLLALSPLEHFKSNRPSILVCSFLFLAFVYDLARCPNLWTVSNGHQQHHGDNNAAFNGLFTASIIVEFMFLALESVQRRRWFGRDAAGYSPEETSSVLSLGLYSWLNQLLWKGYHEPLTMHTLYALDRAISVDTLQDRIKSSLSKQSAGNSTWQVLLWIAKPLGQSLLLPVFPRLCLLGFTFCQPFFLQRLLDFLSSDGDNSLTASGLISVAVLTYSGIAISTSLYWYYQERFQSLLRAFLISSIYRKTGCIVHVGDGDSASITLMGADVERIYTGIRLVHEVWANAIQIALAAWLLQRQLGLAFLAPLIVVLISFAGSFYLSKRAVRYQSAWMARVQQRIGVTSAVLANIKDLRVSGMTNPAAALLQSEREDEIRVGERSRILIAVSASLSQIPQAVAPALAFAFGPHVLDQTRAFTALSFLALLTAPLLVVLQSVPIIAACFACLRRIRVFLDQNGRVDGRVLRSKENTDSVSEDVEDAAILIDNASFGWKAENAILKGVSLRLPRSSITFVIGPVASGKSTLCRALLGEVPHMRGRVVLGSDRLGYCDQAPFLFNASVKENIIGFSSFDALRYNDVIQAAMLADDLNSFPSGDLTIIGTKGVSLSGGQRQRVSLARALYHEVDILILDDIFSGLDGYTQYFVCQSLFGTGGLLRRRGITVVLCTHSTQFAHAADYVAKLSSNEIVLEQASTSEVVREAKLAGRISSLETRSSTIEPEQLTSEKAGVVVRGEQAPLKIRTHPREDHTPAKATPVVPPPPTVDIAVYRHWLSTIGFWPLALYVVLVVGVGFCSNFTTIWVKLWSADSISPAPTHSFAFWIGMYALIGAGAIICVFPGGLIMLRTAVRLSGSNLHHTTVQTIMHSSLRFLTSTDVGKVLNLFSQDMNIMDTQLPRMVNNMCLCLATAIGQAVVIALSSAWLAISYPFFMLLLWVVQRIYLPSSKRLRILDLEAKTPLYTNFLDTLSGLPTIRAFGWFPQQLVKNNHLLDDSQRPSYLLAMAQQWLTLTMNVIVAIVAVVLVTLATQLGSDVGSVGAGLVTLITLGGTMTTIVVAYTGLETSLGAISRLKSFGEATEQEDESDEDSIPPDQWPASGFIQMASVDASYEGSDRVLKGLDLVVPSGQKLAICGRTGSGKSSILSLILRLIDPVPSEHESQAANSMIGSIMIDEVPLTAINRTLLRERIISASQDAIFLPDGTSFRTNLDPWGAASDNECHAVLRDVGIDGVVESKGGIDAPISSSDFSAGQKQLCSLARAVLRRRVKQQKTGIDGGLLLLDEITSNADTETERRVQEILKKEFVSYTVVMVTHRQQLAMASDRVIVLDKGVIMEDGKPNELLQKENGWLRALWHSRQS